MPKKLKTFSFSDTAEKNLSLLMSDLEIHSASECIRYLIDAECVRRGLIKKDTMSEKFSAGKRDRSNANAVKDKDDLLREIQMVSIQMAKYNNRIEDIYKMCYEVRDGVNYQCNFMDAPFTSADTMVEGAAVSKAVQGSCETYEARMRRLSVDKANRR